MAVRIAYQRFSQDYETSYARVLKPVSRPAYQKAKTLVRRQKKHMSSAI